MTSLILSLTGWLEHFFNAQSRLDIIGYVIVCARHTHTTETPLSKTLLFAALEDTIRKTAPLAARFVPASPVGSWVALPRVDLNRVVTFVNKDSVDLPKVLEEIFLQPTVSPEDMPLWRLFVLQDGMVIYAYDHALGDGQSGLAFHHNLLASLRSIQDPPSDHPGIVSSLPEDRTLPPTLEDAMDTTVPISMLLREFFKSKFPFIDRKKAKAWSGHTVRQTPTRVTRVRLLEYTPEQASSLIKLARDNKATLTSTMHTLALVVLSRLIYAQPANKKLKYAVTIIPMSLRRFTGAPPSAICNHVSVYVVYHPLFRPAPTSPVSKETFPWDRASALTVSLRRKLPRSAPMAGIVRYLHGKYDEFILDRLGKKRGAALELSNLGAFPEPKAEGSDAQGKWRIEQMFFVQADGTSGAAVKVNPVGTAAGGLGISVTWGEGAVDDEFGEEFAKAFDEGMNSLAQ